MCTLGLGWGWVSVMLRRAWAKDRRCGYLGGAKGGCKCRVWPGGGPGCEGKGGRGEGERTHAARSTHATDAADAAHAGWGTAGTKGQRRGANRWRPPEWCRPEGAVARARAGACAEPQRVGECTRRGRTKGLQGLQGGSDEGVGDGSDEGSDKGSDKGSAKGPLSVFQAGQPDVVPGASRGLRCLDMGPLSVFQAGQPARASSATQQSVRAVDASPSPALSQPSDHAGPPAPAPTLAPTPALALALVPESPPSCAAAPSAGRTQNTAGNWVTQKAPTVTAARRKKANLRHVYGQNKGDSGWCLGRGRCRGRRKGRGDAAGSSGVRSPRGGRVARLVSRVRPWRSPRSMSCAGAGCEVVRGSAR